MADPPASIPKHWMFCHTARDLRAAVASASPAVPGVRESVADGAMQQESLQTVRVVERSDGTAVPGEWCVRSHLLRFRLRASRANSLISVPSLLGELTDVGRQVGAYVL